MASLRRDIDDALLDEMSRPVWYPILLVYLDWPTGPIRVHSGTGALLWAGYNWAGVGRFGAIGVPGEVPGLQAEVISLGLVGLPEEVLELASAPIRNRRGAIFIGATTAAGNNVLVGEPYLLASGYMDALRYTIQRDGSDLVHGLHLDLGVGPSARAAATVHHSAEDQRSHYPNDTAGRHLIESEKRIAVMKWPED
jgi:hypothetical protein